FFQAEDGIRDFHVTGVQTCALPICSVLLMPTPVKQRKDATLHIYAGINDGYTGSVPISHSLELYNKVVKDFDKGAKKQLIPLERSEERRVGKECRFRWWQEQ